MVKKIINSNWLEDFNLDNMVCVLMERGRKEEMDVFIYFYLFGMSLGDVNDCMSYF